MKSSYRPLAYFTRLGVPAMSSSAIAPVSSKSMISGTNYTTIVLSRSGVRQRQYAGVAPQARR